MEQYQLLAEPSPCLATFPVRNYIVKYQLFKLRSAFAAVLCTFHAEVLFVRKTSTERFKNIPSFFAGMQKNVRSDVGSERGRLFLGTEEGNLNFAFSRVSFPHAHALVSLECKLRGSFFLTFLHSHSLCHKSSGRRGLL